MIGPFIHSIKDKISRGFSIIRDAYMTTIDYTKYYVQNKLLKRVVKVSPKEYKISISQIPQDAQLESITTALLKEREEKVKLEQKVKQLEEQLDKLRQKALAKILEDLAREEKEKGKTPISIAEIIQKAKAKRILPFLKPPVVYDLTMKRIGYLKDIVIHPSGGIAFVIEKGKKNQILTPPFGSLWEAVFHAENLSQQLPHVIILNVVEMEDGKLVKVPEAYINAIYRGEPVEKVIAYLKDQINKLANEAETSKLIAELTAVQNIVDKVDRDVALSLSSASLNLFENMMKTASNTLIPTTLAAIQSNTTLHLELQHQRSLAEHAKELADQYAARLKKLEDSLAPEKIIMIQDRLIQKMEELLSRLTELSQKLSEKPAEE